MGRTFFLTLVGLILAAGTAFSAQPAASFFEIRDGIDNCRAKFLNEKEGRVVFLGGSITTMPGWRALTCDLLRKMFPETKFDFIDAGIGGTNSTFGAFRFENDVFKNGPVDLLFLEFAVNDDGGPATSNRRAMEGIIRRACRLNPKIDIIVQYFADQGKVKTFREGKTPEVITEHDKVVAHYGLPALNLAREITRRLDAGEFTWEQFSRDGCHPLPFGHERYVECIKTFLDAAWKDKPAGGPLQDHVLPAPLDPLNYENGRFIDLEKAHVVRGWKRVRDWDTEKKCNYSGKVDVLVAEKPGATLELEFDGTLVAISAIAGMDAGAIEFGIDGGSSVKRDLFDNYCASFHRPVCWVLAEDLKPGKHVLMLKMSQEHNAKSQGFAARILKFAAN